ncbi:MAG: ATP-binding protein [Sphingobacteriales bacterium JAD_PAG50586_3]|nr:MAG: ATP-binding protein [Sphingobacteriales bacterium JAD_PAG50586_3]
MLKLYNALLNSLSHELRTPISTIIAVTDNLQSNAGKLSEGDKKQLLVEASQASLRLNRQVENLLNMSRLESDVIKPKKDWCDVNELIYSAINSLEDNLQNHKIDVKISKDVPLVKLDFGLMEQVLYNLIYNATLYTPAGTHIQIFADCIKDVLILDVEDNGNGFPPEEVNKVFDKFYRIEHTKAGGTGLGLSIVKGFIEAHSGTITVVNKVPHGARFTIEIPTETSYLNNLKNE